MRKLFFGLMLLALTVGTTFSTVRTVVYIQKETVTGQFIFIKGGHDAGLVPSVYPSMSEPITYCNLKNPDSLAKKQADASLDWGSESALDWTCNAWPASWGAKKSYSIDGYGEDPENTFGLHYWKFDANMDGNSGEWFEFKSFMRQGSSEWWENNIAQSGTPSATINHWGKKGYKTVVSYGANTATFTLISQGVNTPPTASFTVSPSAGNVTTSFSVNASDSVDGQDASSALQVQWDWDNDGVYDTAYTTAKTASKIYSTIGAKTIKLAVKDSGGLVTTTTKTVDVLNTPPVASFTASPNPVIVNSAVSLNASASSDLETAAASLQVRWDFESDGVWDTAYSTTKTASKTYTSTGLKIVKLEVLDANGVTSQETLGVTVNPSGGNNYPGAYSGKFGATLYANGVEFATHWRTASKVFVAGNFNGWALSPLTSLGNGNWYGFVSGVTAGAQYKIVGIVGNVTNWVQDIYGGYTAGDMGNSVVVNHGSYSWTDTAWQRPGWEYYSIYELHVGDFTAANNGIPAARRGTYLGVADMMTNLKELGVTAIELMPASEYGGGKEGWGYNTAIFTSPESAFGTDSNSYATVDEFKAMVNAAHANGIAVVMDMVFNHTGGSNPFWFMDQLDYFDWNNNGVMEAQAGGADASPWGNHFVTWRDVGKNYGLYVLDYWAKNFHIDGYRYDAAHTDYLSWDFIQYVKTNLEARYPGIITILESLPLQSSHNMQGPQWSQPYYKNGKEVLLGTLAVNSANYNNYNQSFCDSINASKNGSAAYSFSPWHVVNYFESHDETSIAGYINNAAAAPWKSRLAAAALIASKGLPMLYSGQEFLMNRVLPDSGPDRVKARPLDWTTTYANNTGVRDYYKGLLNLRKNHKNLREMYSDAVYAYGPYNNIVGYRFAGSGDNTIIILLNFGGDQAGFSLGFLPAGSWKYVGTPTAWNGESTTSTVTSSSTVMFNGSSALVFMQ